MPEYLAPGVYVEEIPTGNKPIEGVSTSTTGLVGVAERGPVNVPQLVTSYGEYQRLFGGRLPIDEFSDGGRAHGYLPHAVEGFFLNGGKRAYITRVLPDIAVHANRHLFFDDPAVAAPGDTVLLRPAQQGTGTAAAGPLLYALDTSNLNINDWIRIGNGSQAEYRQVAAAVGVAQRHVALNLPLGRSHPAGASLRALAAGALAAYGAPFSLEGDAAAGTAQLVVLASAADSGVLLGRLPPLPASVTSELLQIGTGSTLEYAFAIEAVPLNPPTNTRVRLTLSAPLRNHHAPGTQALAIDPNPAGATAATLAIPAHGGDLLVYPDAVAGNFLSAANLVIFEPGAAGQEAQGIGQLASLPLDVETYAPCPAGTLGELVNAAPDNRQVIDLPSTTRIPLNSVAGIGVGMPLVQGANVRTITAVDTVLRVVTVDPPLPAAPAVPSGVTVAGNNFTVGRFPSPWVIPLNTVNGVSPGMALVHGGNNSIVAQVDTTLQLVVLQTALPAAPANGDPLTINGNNYTANRLRRANVLPLSDAAGLAPGMSISVGANGGVIEAIHAGLATIRLQAALPAAPPAGSALAIAARFLTANADAGAVALALDNRLGLQAGDLLRVGAAPDEEYVPIERITGDRGAPPDAGSVILAHPLRRAYPAGTTEVRRMAVRLDPNRQPVFLSLAAAAGAETLLVNDGTGYAPNDVIRLTPPGDASFFHRLSGPFVPAQPREIQLDTPLLRGHDAGQPVLERQPLLEVRALDAGAWGNRLSVGCRSETQGLVSNAQILAANPPPGPGLFSSLQLSSLTGVEPGTILEVLEPDGTALGLPLLKVRRVDRSTRLALLDPPGLQAAHMNAHNNAQLAGRNLRVRSREFSLAVMLRQRPDPAVPTRNDSLLDQELFRHLSMDPRHSRYVTRIVGATWTPGSAADDLGIPLRRWDRRSEGASAYVRVNDLGAPAGQESIRLGPEALVDIMPSGLSRIARHPLGERPFIAGDDAVALMGDAMYVGADSNEPTLRTGLHTLKNLQNVSLVAIPGQTSAALQQAVIDHCEEMRYRFAVLDGPAPDNDTLTDVQFHRQQYDTKYAALYHPWLTIPDPFPSSLATLRQYPIPPSGHVLGLYARVDNERGVHKAPANEVVRGITGLTRYFTKGEQDILNPYPQNINVVRDFRPNNRGIRVWGARCITSDNDYKYVNVRRLLIFLEDSIDRGLQWVVFEPNAEALWARVRRAVTNFLTTVWRNGALEGTTPAEGFFVKCDRTTMTRDDIDNGRLICVIGVAPVKPAEFVIIRIGLWTADAPT
jgi:phage tail sheath protein FI